MYNVLQTQYSIVYYILRLEKKMDYQKNGRRRWITNKWGVGRNLGHWGGVLLCLTKFERTAPHHFFGRSSISTCPIFWSSISPPPPPFKKVLTAPPFFEKKTLVTYIYREGTLAQKKIVQKTVAQKSKILTLH